jgi:hypothetical protein
MSELTYKKIVDVEQVETLNDAATVFINDNGAMKQVPASAIAGQGAGGGGGGYTDMLIFYAIEGDSDEFGATMPYDVVRARIDAQHPPYCVVNRTFLNGENTCETQYQTANRVRVSDGCVTFVTPSYDVKYYSDGHIELVTD